ncbi:AfsR/SARP family transcriptional regulator [Actinokineospora iranica]|uniref:AfsR/SARP family transcriptional regulator n=1 Tax=Actinokineospora iranica TaxID=1271860 RepID=UPI001114314D|nr:BTAD domain-containing putative transcriptional regulator [Actinokineospora iranica]
MRFRLLGPMEVHDGSDWRRIGAAKWRAVLAVLLTEANRVVSVDRIAAELWGDAPPSTVANQVHGYAARLRKLLGGSLVTQAPGYRLVVAAEDIDFGRFAALAEHGRASLRAGRVDAAAAALAEARALWRGAAFEDVPVTPMVEAERARLDELREGVLEDLAEITLRRGDHAAAAAELADLVAEHPLRERLRELRMLALYRQGRQAEALAVYDDLRALLAEELGIDPSPPLRELHERILRADPALAGPRQDGDLAGHALPVRQLPPDVPDFIDRAEPLQAVVDGLSSGTDDGPPPVVVVAGAPGVGKSSLVVHAAHAVSARFPDGQLYLDLEGTSEQPRSPEVMLAEMLSALGVIGGGVPHGPHARASLCRSLLAGRRMLLVLDDAAHAGQIRPLLPATGTCGVLVTSRRRVTDLPGARHIELDVLQPWAARELLTTIVGAARVRTEPEQAEEIVRSCGYLPLAIRISGGRLAGRAGWPLRELRERLADESRRLGELRVGELSVRASFELSLRALPAAAARAFALLGLLGPQTLPGWVLGPLLDEPDADETLDALVDANLIRLTGADAAGQPRYRLHDLLRAYAVEGAAALPAGTRRAAMTRLLTTWLHLAESAAAGLPPSLFRPTPVGGPRAPLPPDVARRVRADPLAWFDAERVTLAAMVALAADRGMDEQAWRLAATLIAYHDQRCLHEDWQRAHLAALRAVRRAGNPLGEAALLCGLGQVRIYRDALDAAVRDFSRSRLLYAESGDRRGEAMAIAGLATVHRVRGDLPRARDHARRALDIVVETGDRHIEAQLRNGLARIALAQGNLDEAGQWLDQAIAIAEGLGDIHRQAVVLREMSELHRGNDNPGAAFDALRAALRIFESLRDERCVAHTLIALGRHHAEHGDAPRTIDAITRAAVIFRDSGDHFEEAKCWQLLGELNPRDRTSARVHLNHALRFWQASGMDDRVTEVRATLARLGR